MRLVDVLHELVQLLFLVGSQHGHLAHPVSNYNGWGYTNLDEVSSSKTQKTDKAGGHCFLIVQSLAWSSLEINQSNQVIRLG